MNALAILAAFLLDAWWGDPDNWPHPVRWIGRLISRLEEKVYPQAHNRTASELYWLGALMTLTILAVVAGAVFLLLTIIEPFRWLYWPTVVYLIYAGICLKDLKRQTWRVELALAAGDLEQARHWLGYVVGRDTADLGEADIRRAVAETLAENFSDGLTAPIFYLALAGPVGLWLYKAINTLDSMIGYRNPRYEHFGRFAARLDDAANYIPARLAGILLVAAAWLTGCSAGRALKILRRDARNHASPNSGYPEAAMAGALGLYLGGAHIYGGALVEKPLINAEGGEPDQQTVLKAERMVRAAAVIMLVPAALAAWLLRG